MAFTHSLATNNYGPAKFIVSATASQGTHTTIASALSDAVSGETIFVRPGTYTEDLTLKAGVNIAAFSGDDDVANVVITGKATATFTGSCSIANIRLTTNSDFILVVSGSNATVVSFLDCYLNCSTTTGISMTTSNAGAVVQLYNCFGNLGTTGIGLYSSSSAGTIEVLQGEFANSGASTTASTNSAGLAIFRHTRLDGPVSTSSTGSIQVTHSEIFCEALNTTAITHNGSGSNAIVMLSDVTSGTATAISIGASATLRIEASRPISSNGTVVSNSGTLTVKGTHNTAVSYSGDSGSAVPTYAGALTLAGAGGVTTSATGSTVTITGSGGAAFDPANTLLIYEDFICTEESVIAGNVFVGNNGWISNGRVFPVSTSAILNSDHPGVILLSVITASVAWFGMAYGTTATICNAIQLGGGELTCIWVFNIHTLSTSGERYIFRVGISDNILYSTTQDVPNGVYFQYSDDLNSGNWQYKTANATTRTTGN